MDYYSILGVAQNASNEEIKKAYRKLARQHHPDISNSADEDSFKNITTAYEVLSDPAKRQVYDLGGDPTKPSGQANNNPMSDIFNMAGEFTQFFTGGGFDGFANKPQVNGNNILYRLQVELKDILLGGENKINITANFKCEICDGTGSKTFDDPVKCQTCQGKGQISKVTNTILGQMMSSSTCPTCQGLGLMPANPCDNCRGKSRLNQTKQFNIKVPKGVNESEQIELTGEGEAGIYNGLAGNLYIEFHIIPDKVFVRDKNNLHCMVQVPFTKSLLGDKANIKTYYGDLEFFIKPNSQRGDTIKIHHYGVPINANSDKKGDLIIHLEISYPHKLNHKQRQIMSEFAKTLNNSETKIEVLDGTTSFS